MAQRRECEWRVGVLNITFDSHAWTVAPQHKWLQSEGGTKRRAWDALDQKQRAGVNEQAVRLCGLAGKRKCDVELERFLSVVDMYDDGPVCLAHDRAAR